MSKKTKTVIAVVFGNLMVIAGLILIAIVPRAVPPMVMFVFDGLTVYGACLSVYTLCTPIAEKYLAPVWVLGIFGILILPLSIIITKIYLEYILLWGGTFVAMFALRKPKADRQMTKQFRAEMRARLRAKRRQPYIK